MRNEKGQFTKGHHWRKDQPFRHKAWLEDHYLNKELSAGDISRMFNVTDAAILFWLRKHKIKRRSISETRKLKKWGLHGVDNPMWNRRGELNPRWMGGITPERQEFYTSNDWKMSCRSVWERDRATCQRCNLKKNDRPDMPFHIHHIESFAVVEKRSDPRNLVLLCEACHHFVHSKRNISRDFLPKI